MENGDWAILGVNGESTRCCGLRRFAKRQDIAKGVRKDMFFYKAVKVVEGCAGGYVVVEDGGFERPVATVNIPLEGKEASKEVAEFIAAEMNKRTSWK